VAILFLVALVLAWPTYGLSILVWIVLAVVKANKKQSNIQQRQSRATLLEPLFNERYSEFFNALDVPMVHGYVVTADNAEKCGRHIVNYIAHNPQEGAVFTQGLRKWHTKGDVGPLDPVLAAESETKFDAKGEIHLVSYRAIEALMTNNKSLTCFNAVDFGGVVEERTNLELAALLSR
jgi:hypothetical protein